MQVIDKGSNAPAPTQGLDSKKAAVIAKLAATMQQPKAAPNDTPVPNPSKISPEEMSAIIPSSTSKLESTEPTSESGQEPKDGTPDSSEAVSAESTATPKAPEEPLSAQYAQLARKEKAMRLEAQKLKSEREAFKAEQDALRAPPKPSIDESKYIDKARFESDPLAALAEMGISYDSLTQRALNAPTPDQIELSRTISELRNQIKELKDGQDGVKKTFQEQQDNSYKQALNQISNDVKSLVYSGDTYELVKATNSTKDVVDLIEKTFKEGLDDDHPKGTLLSVEDAAKIVEDYLEGEALKLARLKKIQTKLRPVEVPPATPAKAAGTEAAPKQSQVKTLTNSMATSKQYSAKERALLAAQYGPDWRSKVS